VKHPEVVIIWTPGDGKAYMVGSGRKDGEWKYSKDEQIPARELPHMIRRLKKLGMRPFDFREQAKAVNPGMERATPILLVRSDVPTQDGVEAYKILLNAILAADDKKAREGRG
jgi:hypothetical protein